jgi:hypothetical protein
MVRPLAASTAVEILLIKFFIEKEPHSQPEISEDNIEEEKCKGG